METDLFRCRLESMKEKPTIMPQNRSEATFL